MAIDASRTLQFQEGSIGQHNGPSEFLRIAAQFLANTPAPKTCETYGRELGSFVSWYDKNSSIVNITFEDL